MKTKTIELINVDKDQYGKILTCTVVGSGKENLELEYDNGEHKAIVFGRYYWRDGFYIDDGAVVDCIHTGVYEEDGTPIVVPTLEWAFRSGNNPMYGYIVDKQDNCIVVEFPHLGKSGFLKLKDNIAKMIDVGDTYLFLIKHRGMSFAHIYDICD